MNDLAARLCSRFVAGYWALANMAMLGPAERSAAGYGPAPDQRHPVLLIHGINDSALSMQTMRTWLAGQGWQVYTISLVPNDGSRPLQELAQQVRAYVDQTFPRGQKIDLVGFSMGGLVCRYYVQRLGGAERVAHFVTISAPNHGTCLAYLSKRPGCVQMRPGSQFLTELNADTSELKAVQFASLWSPLDLTILPARSSRMPVGSEATVWVIAHPYMVLYPGSWRQVARFLSQPAAG